MRPSVNLWFLAGGLLAASACGVASGQITQVAYSGLTGLGSEDFQSLTAGAPPGTNYNGVVAGSGVSFAERYSGQTLGSSGTFDVVSGSPSGTLALQAGAASQNLCIFTLPSSTNNVLSGLGPDGFSNFSAIGEGSLAFLFAQDQSEFGFELLGGQSGSADISFYARNGSLIQTITLTGITSQGYGFQRNGSLMDIAGVLIQNSDAEGIGLDNLRFTIPGPGAGSMFVALVGWKGRRLRRHG